jgi:hypothetical protein
LAGVGCDWHTLLAKAEDAAFAPLDIATEISRRSEAVISVWGLDLDLDKILRPTLLCLIVNLDTFHLGCDSKTI